MKNLIRLKISAKIKSIFSAFKFDFAKNLTAKSNTGVDLFSDAGIVKDSLVWDTILAKIIKNPAMDAKRIYREKIKIGKLEYSLIFIGGFNEVNYLAGIEGIKINGKYRKELNKYELYLFIESACRPREMNISFRKAGEGQTQISRQVSRSLFHAFPALFFPALIAELSSVRTLPNWYYFYFFDQNGRPRLVDKNYLQAEHNKKN